MNDVQQSYPIISTSTPHMRPNKGGRQHRNMPDMDDEMDAMNQAGQNEELLKQQIAQIEHQFVQTIQQKVSKDVDLNDINKLVEELRPNFEINRDGKYQVKNNELISFLGSVLARNYDLNVRPQIVDQNTELGVQFQSQLVRVKEMIEKKEVPQQYYDQETYQLIQEQQELSKMLIDKKRELALKQHQFEVKK